MNRANLGAESSYHLCSARSRVGSEPGAVRRAIVRRLILLVVRKVGRSRRSCKVAMTRAVRNAKAPIFFFQARMTGTSNRRWCLSISRTAMRSLTG